MKGAVFVKGHGLPEDNPYIYAQQWTDIHKQYRVQMQVHLQLTDFHKQHTM